MQHGYGMGRDVGGYTRKVPRFTVQQRQAERVQKQEDLHNDQHFSSGNLLQFNVIDGFSS